MTNIRTSLDTMLLDLKSLCEAADTLSRDHNTLLQCVVEEWGDAKFASDFARADRLREVLRAIGIEPIMGTKYYSGTRVFVCADLPKHVRGNPVGNTWRYL